MTTRIDLSHDIKALTPGLVALRRALHQHPELAFDEVWTVATLAGRLRAAPLQVRQVWSIRHQAPGHHVKSKRVERGQPAGRRQLDDTPRLLIEQVRRGRGAPQSVLSSSPPQRGRAGQRLAH